MRIYDSSPIPQPINITLLAITVSIAAPNKTHQYKAAPQARAARSQTAIANATGIKMALLPMLLTVNHEIIRYLKSETYSGKRYHFLWDQVYPFFESDFSASVNLAHTNSPLIC